MSKCQINTCVYIKFYVDIAVYLLLRKTFSISLAWTPFKGVYANEMVQLQGFVVASIVTFVTMRKTTFELDSNSSLACNYCARLYVSQLSASSRKNCKVMDEMCNITLRTRLSSCRQWGDEASISCRPSQEEIWTECPLLGPRSMSPSRVWATTWLVYQQTVYFSSIFGYRRCLYFFTQPLSASKQRNNVPRGDLIADISPPGQKK